MYGIQGGFELARMLRYVRNDDDESINDPYSLIISVTFLGQSNRLIGAQSIADRTAR